MLGFCLSCTLTAGREEPCQEECDRKTAAASAPCVVAGGPLPPYGSYRPVAVPTFTRVAGRSRTAAFAALTASTLPSEVSVEWDARADALRHSPRPGIRETAVLWTHEPRPHTRTVGCAAPAAAPSCRAGLRRPAGPAVLGRHGPWLGGAARRRWRQRRRSGPLPGREAAPPHLSPAAAETAATHPVLRAADRAKARTRPLTSRRTGPGERPRTNCWCSARAAPPGRP